MIAGVGGLGSAIATYLVSAGVGTVRLVDSGRVEESNLNRQVLYTEIAIGAPKVDVAAARLGVINSDITIEPVFMSITKNTVNEIAFGADLIIDGLDDDETRHILNKYSVENQVPYLYGAVQEWEGYVSFFNPPVTPCLACLNVPRAQEKKQDQQVLGVASGLIGLHQATEALIFLSEGRSPLSGKLMIMDCKRHSIEIVSLGIDPTCSVCAGRF
jgi:adenylyltransferase/sulfurtransferase